MAGAVEGLKIGVGTKIDDVYGDKQAFEQARLADKNGDHVIDEAEWNCFAGKSINRNGLDYYPGLTLDKSGDVKTFADIDIDGNKSLSTEEISLYSKKDKVRKIQKDKKSLESFYKQYLGMHAILALGIGVQIALAIHGGLLVSTLPITLPLFLLLCSLGFIGFRVERAKYDKQLKELEPQVEKETAQILGKTKETKDVKETKEKNKQINNQ